MVMDWVWVVKNKEVFEVFLNMWFGKWVNGSDIYRDRNIGWFVLEGKVKIWFWI